MTPDMTTRYYGHKREMAGFSHTLAILMSMLRVCLEYGWSMARVCLEAGKKQPRDCNATLIAQGDRPCVRAFRYVVCLLLLMVGGVGEMWGDDYSGKYYIASDAIVNGSPTYDANTPANNYYLCPTEGWCYYKATNSYDADGTTYPNPFLTTYKWRDGINDNKAIWIIEKHPTLNYYYFKQHIEGNRYKYLMLNGQISGTTNKNRMRVHLEEHVEDTDNPTTNALFSITLASSANASSLANAKSVIITPKNTENEDKQCKYLVVNGGNANALTGQDGKSDGPGSTNEKYKWTKGIIGLYFDDKGKQDANAPFYLENKPTISFSDQNLIRITYFDYADNEVEIRYTTNDDVPTASSTLYQGPFDPPAGTTTIKAIAIKNGKESDVVTFTPVFFFGENHKYLIQSQGNGWTTGDFQGNHFYMIPGDEEVNTTSMFRPSMQWYILGAGDNYYYIVNVDNTRMRYDSTNGIHLDTWDEGSANEFKFQIVESATAGTYNIIPYGVTGYYLNKAGGNGDYRPLALHNNANDANSRWKFVKKNALVETAPFTVTDNNSITYYKLQTATTYYIAPPSLTGGAVTVSNSTDADVINSRNWYFEVAQASSNDDWLTWYYIRNAVTGDYLYYSGPNPSNDAATFITKGSLNETDVNDMKRYRFTWVRSATADSYFIVPQLLKDETQNYISGLNRNSTALRIQKKRSGNESLWQFVTADYTIAPPNIVYNADVNTVSLSCTTPGATIYYTTDNNEATTTSGNSGTSIDLKAEGKEGVTIIRAIAEVSGTSSREAINNIIVQATVGNAKRPYLIRNNQSPWTWTVGNETITMFVYYMIPSDVVSNNTTVNTTSMPRPTMEWYFEHAGKADGKQYYYIVNAITGDYLYRTGSAIYMKTSSDKTSLEASDNGFKFYLIPRAASGSNHAGYSIVPYGETTTNFVSKASGNNNAAAVKLEGTDNDFKRWNFVTKTDLMNDLAAKLPFTPSSGSSSTYYKIENGNTDYGTQYVIPPVSESGNATASTSEEAAVVKSGSWYFAQVQTPTNDDWLTYYKIINAETGKALYYINDNSNCLKVGDYVENNSNYMFAFVKSPKTDYYYIVPKAVKDNQLANISTFWRDVSYIKPATTRGTDKNVWTFTPATLFCNDPVFVEEGGVIKIKCNTNAANIYINTESNDDPDSNSTLYAPTPSTQNWATTDQVRIKAIAIVSNGTNTASSDVITLLNKPNVTLEEGPFVYKADYWEPAVTLSIGETTATTGFTPTYNNNKNAGTANVTITNSDPIGTLYVFNGPLKEFTIDPAPLTVTANTKNIGYGDEPDNDGVTYSGFVGNPAETEETEGVFGGMLEYSYTTTGDNPHPYTPYDPLYGNKGDYVITPSGLTSTNYDITFVSGTMTVGTKSIGDGTLAEGFTLDFDENSEVILEYGTHPLTKDVDYTIGSEVIGTKYSTRDFNGIGNYTGYFTLRNANVNFQTDADRVEWSATFVAEPVGENARDNTKGHALPEGITAYIITDIVGNWAIPEPLTYIPEGIPVLLISNRETGGFIVKDASGHTPITTTGDNNQKDANMLKEVATLTHFNTKTIYLLSKNEFVYNLDGDLAVGKVYLDPTPLTSPAPRLRIKWDDMTSITELQNHGTTEPPNDNWYTLDGRKLNKKPTQKGMYLVNGKKVVIR